MQSLDQPPLLPSREEMERAFTCKDASYDGIFFVGVRTTGIFCRPSCPSRPRLENTEFFASFKACFFAGYRPCKRCHPLSVNGEPPAWIADIMERVRQSESGRLHASELRLLEITPERVRRWFVQNLGMTFSEWCRGRRLAGAFDRLREGMKLDDVALESGFESHSGFRDAFARVFHQAPGRARLNGGRIVLSLLESPLGPILSGASESGICLLEFTDRRLLETNLQTLRERFEHPVVVGQSEWLRQLKEELRDYFAGKVQGFSVPLDSKGTPFQERVWSGLRRIPFGRTVSYDELAVNIGRPTAQRAVANANGQNRISILIPCHRVIGKDGSLTGYGGGLWRKRLLLELERTGHLPGQR